MATVDVVRQFVGGGIIAANKPIAEKFGLSAAVLLHELAYWCERSEDGWCYRTRDELRETTTLSHEVQASARKILVGAGVIQEERRGIPSRLYYFVDFDALAACFDGEGRQQETGITATVGRNHGQRKPDTRFLYKEEQVDTKLQEQVSLARNSDSDISELDLPEELRGLHEKLRPQLDQFVQSEKRMEEELAAAFSPAITPVAPAAKQSRVMSSELDNMFTEFYNAYPKKMAKGKARAAFMKLKPDRELFGKMMVGLERWKTSRSWKNDGGKYIPYPASWINGERWEDEALWKPYVPSYLKEDVR